MFVMALVWLHEDTDKGARSVTNNHAVSQDAIQALTGVVRLGSHAATRAWALSQDEEKASPLSLFGMGAHWVACDALALLPQDIPVTGPVPLETDPVLLLVAALDLMETLPIEAYPPGASALIVALADLVREWTP